MKVGIALATYNPNSEFFLQQVRSLQEQDFANWVCVVSDESTDPVLKAFLQQTLADDPRFQVLPGDGRQRGVFYNFERALRALHQTDAELIAFCDQDDLWEPHKLSTMIEFFATHPESFLAHSDLCLIDSQNGLIAESCWREESRQVSAVVSPVSLLLRNSVTGCACVFRSELLATALPFPAGVQGEYLHDHWLAMIARVFGPLGVLREPLVRYRQHSANVVGAQSSGKSRWSQKLKSLRSIAQKGDKALGMREKLAADFLGRVPRDIQRDVERQLAPILGRSPFFYFCYFLRSIGKPFEFALSVQLLYASVLGEL